MFVDRRFSGHHMNLGFKALAVVRCMNELANVHVVITTEISRTP